MIDMASKQIHSGGYQIYKDTGRYGQCGDSSGSGRERTGGLPGKSDQSLLGETKTALDALVKVTDEGCSEKKREPYRRTSITLMLFRLWRHSAHRLTNWR